MNDINFKFKTKSSLISIINLKYEKNDSKLKVRIKSFQRNAGDHHQKQLLDEDDGLKKTKKNIENILNK